MVNCSNIGLSTAFIIDYVEGIKRSNSCSITDETMQ